MDTIILGKGTDDYASAVDRAAEVLRAGGLVGIPTETVYGLGANALDAQAVESIFTAKGRPADNPLIVHISDMASLKELVRHIPKEAQRLMEAFWPGPLTIILPKSETVPEIVTAGLETVAVRFPANKLAQRIIAASGLPIAAPSANLSGSPSPTGAMHVYDDFQGKIPLIVDGGDCEIGVESTVVTFMEDGTPLILRPGGVTAEAIKDCVGRVELHKAIMKPLGKEKALSPGMMYKHYAPNAKITIVFGSEKEKTEKILNLRSLAECSKIKTMIIASGERTEYQAYDHIVLASAEEAAAQIYGLLRDLDKQGYQEILIEAFGTDGMGLAVMNRLARASGFNFVNA